MRSALSIPAVAAAAATLFVTAVAVTIAAPARTPRAAPPPDLTAAVARTVAAGSARVTGTATSADGAVATLDGVTSFATGASAVTVRGALDGATTEVEVRTTPEGTWLRTAPNPTWTPIGDDVARRRAADAGWSDLLRRLRGANGLATIDGDGRRLRGILGSRRLEVELDGAGRIGRIRLLGDGSRLDLRLHDLGAAVDVAAPAGAARAAP